MEVAKKRDSKLNDKEPQQNKRGRKPKQQYSTTAMRETNDFLKLKPNDTSKHSELSEQTCSSTQPLMPSQQRESVNILSERETPIEERRPKGKAAKDNSKLMELPEQFEFELEQADKAPFSDVLGGLQHGLSGESLDDYNDFHKEYSL